MSRLEKIKKLINSGDGGGTAAIKSDKTKQQQENGFDNKNNDPIAKANLIQHTESLRDQRQQQDLHQNESNSNIINNNNNNNIYASASAAPVSELHHQQYNLNEQQQQQLGDNNDGSFCAAATTTSDKINQSSKNRLTSTSSNYSQLNKKSRLGAANDHNYNLHPATEILTRQIELEQSQRQSSSYDNFDYQSKICKEPSNKLSIKSQKASINATTETKSTKSQELIENNNNNNSPGQMDECMAAMVLIKLSTKPTTATSNSKSTTPNSNINNNNNNNSNEKVTSSSTNSSCKSTAMHLHQYHPLPKKSKKDLDDEGFIEEDVENMMILQGEINAMNSMMNVTEEEAAAVVAPAIAVASSSVANKKRHSEPIEMDIKNNSIMNNKRRFRTSSNGNVLDNQELRMRRRKELNKAIDDDVVFEPARVGDENVDVEIFELEETNGLITKPRAQVNSNNHTAKLEILSVDDEMMFEMQQVHKVEIDGCDQNNRQSDTKLRHERETGFIIKHQVGDPHKLNVELLNKQLLVESKRQMEAERKEQQQLHREEQLRLINTNNNNSADNYDDQDEDDFEENADKNHIQILNQAIEQQQQQQQEQMQIQMRTNMKSRTIFSCMWPGCIQIYDSLGFIERHVRAHFGPKQFEAIGDEDFYYEETEVDEPTYWAQFAHLCSQSADDCMIHNATPSSQHYLHNLDHEDLNKSPSLVAAVAGISPSHNSDGLSSGHSLTSSSSPATSPATSDCMVPNSMVKNSNNINNKWIIGSTPTSSAPHNSYLFNNNNNNNNNININHRSTTTTTTTTTSAFDTSFTNYNIVQQHQTPPITFNNNAKNNQFSFSSSSAQALSRPAYSSSSHNITMTSSGRRRKPKLVSSFGVNDDLNQLGGCNRPRGRGRPKANLSMSLSSVNGMPNPVGRPRNNNNSSAANPSHSAYRRRLNSRGSSTSVDSSRSQPNSNNNTTISKQAGTRKTATNNVVVVNAVNAASSATDYSMPKRRGRKPKSMSDGGQKSSIVSSLNRNKSKQKLCNNNKYCDDDLDDDHDDDYANDTYRAFIEKNYLINNFNFENMMINRSSNNKPILGQGFFQQQPASINDCTTIASAAALAQVSSMALTPPSSASSSSSSSEPALSSLNQNHDIKKLNDDEQDDDDEDEQNSSLSELSDPLFIEGETSKPIKNHHKNTIGSNRARKSSYNHDRRSSSSDSGHSNPPTNTNKRSMPSIITSNRSSKIHDNNNNNNNNNSKLSTPNYLAKTASSNNKIHNTTTSQKSQQQAVSARGRAGRGENRKCRKVYGMDKRDIWCTQCKWKKACSRFSDPNQIIQYQHHQLVQQTAPPPPPQHKQKLSIAP